MELLVDGSIRNYALRLASDAPAPGGGSAAALAGAIGISLAGMVGALTEGRAKYAEYAEFVADLLAQAQSIQNEFLVLVDEDVAVFNAMSAAYKMPKDTADDKSSRTAAIQAALKNCTVTPYRMLGLCLGALELTARAIGKTNSNVTSDLGVAALCLKAAAQGAWLNILINLGSIRDVEFVAMYRDKSAAALDEAIKMADDIFEQVKTSLTRN